MFKFSLEPVLEHRKAIEEKRSREHGEVLSRINRFKGDVHEYEEQVLRSHKAISEGIQRGVNPAYGALFGECIVGARAEMERIEAEIKQLEAEAEKRRLALAESAKARMIIEELRDEEQKKFRAEQARAEQRMFDEVAIREFVTRQREENLA